MSTPAFWTCDDATERLHHTELEEAVFDCIEAQAEPNESRRDTIKRLAPLTVYGWTRDVVDDRRIQSVSEWAVERIQDDIDDELSDPDGGERVLKDDQARELKQTIIEKLTEMRSAGQLVPWSCSQTEERVLTEAELLAMFASEVADDDRERAEATP